MATVSILIFAIIVEQFTFVEPRVPETDVAFTSSNDFLDRLTNSPTKVDVLASAPLLQNDAGETIVNPGVLTLPMAHIVGPKSCPYYHVVGVDNKYQGYMKKLWVVVAIVPNGKSTYLDGTAACGLRNFVVNECKCLRYYLDFEKDESIIMQTMSLHIGLQSYRYSENRMIFIDKKVDVFQAQHVFSAIINAKSLYASTTISPVKEELFPEYEPFALIGTDNYETYAVYATCSHNTDTPLAWIALSEKEYLKGVPSQVIKEVREILQKDGINLKSFVWVDQKKCLQMLV